MIIMASKVSIMPYLGLSNPWATTEKREDVVFIDNCFMKDCNHILTKPVMGQISKSNLKVKSQIFQ